MNMFRNSLNSSLRVLGLRQHGDFGFQSKCWKFFSINNSVQFRKSNGTYTSNNLHEFSEVKNKVGTRRLKSREFNPNRDIDEEDIDGLGSHVMSYERTYENGDIHESVEHENLIGEQNPTLSNTNRFGNDYNEGTSMPTSVQRNQASCFHLLRHLLQWGGPCADYIHMLDEESISSLINKGLKPEYIFVNHEDVIDNLSVSLEGFPIYDTGHEMKDIFGTSRIIGVFRHEQLRDLAKNIKPKVPIKVICDSVTDFKFLCRLWSMAAETGCEHFIFTECRKFFVSQFFRGIECCNIRTDFNYSIDEAIDGLDPNYKVLAVAPAVCKPNSAKENINFHHLDYEDAWETGKVALFVCGRPLTEIMNQFAGRDMKFIRMQYYAGSLFSSQTYAALFQLVKEYQVKNSQQKRKNKKSTRKKSEVETS